MLREDPIPAPNEAVHDAAEKSAYGNGVPRDIPSEISSTQFSTAQFSADDSSGGLLTHLSPKRHKALWTLTLLAGGIGSGINEFLKPDHIATLDVAGAVASAPLATGPLNLEQGDFIVEYEANALDHQKLAELKEAALKRDNELRTELIDKLSPEAQRELALRERRAGLNAQYGAIVDLAELSIQQYRDHPFLRKQWERTLDTLRRKIDPIRKTVNNSGAGALSSFEANLREYQRLLRSYVELYEIKAPTSMPLSGRELLETVERIDRAAAISARHDTVRAILSKQDNSVQTLQKYDREWEKLLAGFGRPWGWARWDPRGLSQAEHRKVMIEMDQFLSGHEATLKIIPARSDAALAESYAQRLVELHNFDERLSAHDEMVRRIFLIRTGDQSAWTGLVSASNPEEKTLTGMEGDDQVVNTFRGQRLVRSKRTHSDGTSTTSTFFDSGAPSTRIEWQKEKELSYVDSSIRYREDGTPISFAQRADRSYTYYSKAGLEVGTIRFASNDTVNYCQMFDGKGGSFGSYVEHRRIDPKLTTRSYLQLLARELDSPEELHAYFSLTMHYTSDGSSTTEQAQTAVATLQRGDHMQMLGDCEDYAFLVREILRLQGIKAYVVIIPNHAECVWLTKRSDGRYDAHSLGTFGYDLNGNRFGDVADPEKAKGYKTARDGLNALMQKYKFPELGLSEGQAYTIGDSTQLYDFDGWGNVYSHWVRTESLLP